jgi:hypothetical protein
LFGGISFEDGIEAFRERIRLMTDEKLVETGKACRSLCSESNSDTWAQQLKVLIEEWRLRHPKK